MPKAARRTPRNYFGRTAVAMGLATPQQVADCLDLQRRLSQGGRAIAIGKIMLAKGYLTAYQIQEVLEAQARQAVRCATCGAEFAVGPMADGGPARCPSCLRRLSGAVDPHDRRPAGPAGGVDVTQELETAPVPPGPGLGLHVELRDGPSMDVEAPPGETIEIGRSPPGAGAVREGGRLALPDQGLSRRHCRVTNERGRLEVEDLGSRNGTFLNGQRIVRQALRPGDEIEVGSSRILVRAPRHSGDPGNTTELWKAEGLCMLCGNVVPPDDLASGRAQKAKEGIVCEKCLEVALVPGRVLAGYRIIQQIGFGGMAEVYRAEKVSSGQIVAIKTLLDPLGAGESTKARFVREARASARLEHPNLVRIYDAGQEGGIPYIVMECVEGYDLADILDRKGTVDVLVAFDVALDIAAALAYAHGMGVIHRDVKPANIILDSVYGRARLLDLGVAKIHDLDEKLRLTRSGTGLGTLDYASPEQIESARDADGRADVYSLGATVYRMVVGRRPFVAERELDLARAIIEDPLAWPGEAEERVPAGLRRVVERAMAKRPSSRFPDAEAMRRALAEARESLV